jgi:hypothetical protein
MEKKNEKKTKKKDQLTATTALLIHSSRSCDTALFSSACRPSSRPFPIRLRSRMPPVSPRRGLRSRHCGMRAPP